GKPARHTEKTWTRKKSGTAKGAGGPAGKKPPEQGSAGHPNGDRRRKWNIPRASRKKAPGHSARNWKDDPPGKVPAGRPKDSRHKTRIAFETPGQPRAGLKEKPGEG